MIHGTSDRRRTWCGESLVGLSWCIDPGDVECIACLRAEVERECPRRTPDGGVWYCMSCPRCLGGVVFTSGANDDAPEIESECSECPGQCEACAGPKTLGDAMVTVWDWADLDLPMSRVDPSSMPSRPTRFCEGGGEMIGLDDKDYIIKLEDEIERLKQERDEAGRTAVNWHREFKKLEAKAERLNGELQGIILERDQLLDVQKELEAESERLRRRIEAAAALHTPDGPKGFTQYCDGCGGEWVSQNEWPCATLRVLRREVEK